LWCGKSHGQESESDDLKRNKKQKFEIVMPVRWKCADENPKVVTIK
jgi:hypothetical protein